MNSDASSEPVLSDSLSQVLETLWYHDALSNFQVPGFNALTMTYHNQGSSFVCADITGFLWVDLWSKSVMTEYRRSLRRQTNSGKVSDED